MKPLLVTLTLIISLVLFPAKAWAHGMWADFQLNEQILEITTVFTNDEVIEPLAVQVFAPTNAEQPWLETSTDENGFFAFEPDPTLEGEWTIYIGRGDHGDILTVPVSNDGIDEWLISQAPFDAPHWWMKQMAIGGVAFSSGLGSVVWSRRRWS